jgi:hypothetical protein
MNKYWTPTQKGSNILLTFSAPQKFRFEKLKNDSKKKDRDSVCKLAVKRMLERIRKKTKKSVRHWFITELGENTGRIHLHGICWGNPDLVKENWKYGFVFQFFESKFLWC